MREVAQLLKAANFYFGQAESVLSEHERLESKTIGQITKRHSRRGLSPSKIILAYFAFSAVRLATICEIKGYQLTEELSKEVLRKIGPG